MDHLAGSFLSRRYDPAVYKLTLCSIHMRAVQGQLEFVRRLRVKHSPVYVSATRIAAAPIFRATAWKAEAERSTAPDKGSTG
jgi:hypothetical protein